MDSLPTFAVAVTFLLYSSSSSPYSVASKSGFLRFYKSPCLARAWKYISKREKRLFSFLSSTWPQIFTVWRHRKPLLALYMQVILFSVGIVQGTIMGMTELCNLSQCRPYSCSRLTEMNYSWQWSVALVSCVFMEVTQVKAFSILNSHYSSILEYKIEYVKCQINATARNT